MSVNPILSFLGENQNQKFITINQNTRNLNAIVQLTVADIAAPPSTPPPTTSGGTPLSPAYILPNLTTGDFAFNENNIVYWDGASWVFIAPSDGWLAYIQDDNQFRYFSRASTGSQGTPGTWTILTSGGSGLPTGGTADQLLAKIDGTDFNTEWVDPPAGSNPNTAYEFIRSVTLSGGISPGAIFASADFDDTLYDAYELLVQNLVPATDNVSLRLRTSTDGGTSFDDGASDYGTDISDQAASTGDHIPLNFSTTLLGSAANEDGWSGSIRILRPHTTDRTMITFNGGYFSSSGSFVSVVGGGARLSSEDTDAVQLNFSSGNVDTGKVSFYGIRNSA